MNTANLFFGLETETICSVDSNQKISQDFEIDSIKYQLDTEHEDDLLPPGTAVKPILQIPLQCKLDLTEAKQLQGQYTHLSKIIAKCISCSHHDKTPYHLDENGIVYRKARDGSNTCVITVPQRLQPYILYDVIML